MKQYVSYFFTALFGLLVVAAPVATAVDIGGDACKINPGSAMCKNKDEKNKVRNLTDNIINTLLFVLGIICTIVIVVGGIRYATSGGDANQTKAAKDTILYAVVGLVVAILAYAIVNFVLDNIS